MLLTAGEIDDGEAAMAERDPRQHVKALTVRPAVGDGITHAFDQSGVKGKASLAVIQSYNAAHVNYSGLEAPIFDSSKLRAKAVRIDSVSAASPGRSADTATKAPEAGRP